MVGKPTYSFVCPTRNRQLLASNFAKFALPLVRENIQIVVSDNSDKEIDRSELRKFCESANIEYVRPPRVLTMTEHWNFALDYANGDYIGFFTDKMVPIPSSLISVFQLLESLKVSHDIVSWNANSFTPHDFAAALGPGAYTRLRQQRLVSETFDPQMVLRSKIENVCHRSKESMSEYARGKICFGMYSRGLVARAQAECGALFHPFAPDYSSASIGLSLAKSGVHFQIPCACQINLPISNGALFAAHDEHARHFMESQPGTSLSDLPVPGLYSSVSNLVAHDWATYSRLSGIPEVIDLVDWIDPIFDDVTTSKRIWSSKENYLEQMGCLKIVLKELNDADLLRRFNVTIQQEPIIRATDQTNRDTCSWRDYLIPLRRFYRKTLLRNVHMQLNSLLEIRELTSHVR